MRRPLQETIELEDVNGTPVRVHLLPALGRIAEQIVQNAKTTLVPIDVATDSYRLLIWKRWEVPV
jgi:hypothetical protein